MTDIFLADQFKKAPDAVKETVTDAPDIVTEKELASLIGLYFDPITLRSIGFYMKDGKLMVAWGGEPSPSPVTADHVLSPLSRNRFKVVGAFYEDSEIVFVRPIAGPMQVKNIFGGKTYTFDAVQNVPSSIQLAEFTGKYLSDELGGATYALSIKDGKLLLLVTNGITVFSDKGLVLAFSQPSGREAPKDILLTPAFADAFLTSVSDEPVMLRFTRNQQNAISGFTLSTYTIRRVRFNKL